MTHYLHSYFSDGDTYYTSDVNAIIDNFKAIVVNTAIYSSEIDLGTFATDFSVNFGNRNRQHATLTGNADITLLTSDLTGAANYTLSVDGNFTYTFNSDVVIAPDGVVSHTIASDVEHICGLYYTDRDSKFRLVVSTNFE
jgi:hypothetical protein